MPVYKALQPCYAGDLRKVGDQFEYTYFGATPPYVEALEPVVLKEAPPARSDADSKRHHG